LAQPKELSRHIDPQNLGLPPEKLGVTEINQISWWWQGFGDGDGGSPAGSIRAMTFKTVVKP
jgi:hypothetical protein